MKVLGFLLLLVFCRKVVFGFSMGVNFEFVILICLFVFDIIVKVIDVKIKY